MVKSARMHEPNAMAFEVSHMAKCELDRWADTICCGINFRPLAFTGQLCEVRGFHDSLDTLTDIMVACCVTTFTHSESGARFVLVINEALYLGKTMGHSLMDPNQIRSFKLPVSDNPFDLDRPFGINHEGLFVAFRTEGSTVYFDTSVPSDEEFESCQMIELTDGNT